MGWVALAPHFLVASGTYPRETPQGLGRVHGDGNLE